MGTAESSTRSLAGSLFCQSAPSDLKPPAPNFCRSSWPQLWTRGFSGTRPRAGAHSRPLTRTPKQMLGRFASCSEFLCTAVESLPDSLQDGDGKITYAELQQVLEDDELLTEVPAILAMLQTLCSLCR